MNTDKDKGNPDKVYRDELANKGSTFSDTPLESEARDRAKMERTASEDSQKIDGNNPYADEDTVDDDAIRRETLEKK